MFLGDVLTMWHESVVNEDTNVSREIFLENHQHEWKNYWNDCSFYVKTNCIIVKIFCEAACN